MKTRQGETAMRPVRFAAVVFGFWVACCVVAPAGRGATGEGLVPAVVLPTNAVPAGGKASLTLTWLNLSGSAATARFPGVLSGHWRPEAAAGAAAGEPVTWIRKGAGDAEASLEQTEEVLAGALARRTYEATVPAAWSGPLILELAVSPGTTWTVRAERREDAAVSGAGAGAEAGGTAGRRPLLSEAQQASKPYLPEQFFREHFFGYEPIYFIAGTEVPNAKFQISLRYQLVANEGALARHAPFLKGLSVAYTQTSLWDLSSPSAPFFDSSYKPEALYVWERVDGGRWADWVRLDLQGGLQHESNGKAGLDSRSLNIGYFRPRLTLGPADGFQFTIQPRVWGYVGDLNDNPDLKDYRGYGDLRLTAGWARGLQVSATGRVGDDGDNGAVQVDVTYPMMRLLSGSFSVYLHAQYFNGYGESLLEYNRRSDAFRVGFGLYR